MTENELHEKITEVSKTIFSYCMAKTPTREEAEDLSQDILCALIKSAENIRDDRAFYAFMWGVAGNVYKQWYRKKLKNCTCELTDDIASSDAFSEDDQHNIYLLRRELALLSEKFCTTLKDALVLTLPLHLIFPKAWSNICFSNQDKY